MRIEFGFLNGLASLTGTFGRIGKMAICGLANTRLLAGAAALALVAGLALGVAPAGAQDFTMKLATLTINDSQHEFLKMYKAEIEKVSNGRIKAEIYPAGQLGNAQRQSE